MAKKVEEKSTKEPTTMAVERAYNYIKDLTIDFLIKPSVQINEIEIANQIELSRVPVREALNRLVMSGFVTLEPGKGFFCRKFSESEMKELYAVRLDLEVGSVVDACRQGSDDDISKILSECSGVLETFSNMSMDELIHLDEELHIRIAKLSGNMERISYLLNIFDRIRFVRRIQIENENRRNEFIGEHVNLMKAIAKRDEKASIELIDYHLGINSQGLKDNIRTGMLRIYAADIS